MAMLSYSHLCEWRDFDESVRYTDFYSFSNGQILYANFLRPDSLNRGYRNWYERTRRFYAPSDHRAGS